MRTGTLYTLGQLHFHLEHYQQALDYLETWLASAQNPGPEPHILIGQAMYQLGRYEDAVVPVQAAIAEATDRGQEPREHWYGLLRVIYYETGDLEHLIDVLEILVTRFPSKEYWLHLASAFGEADDPRRQLAAYELAYAQGYLRSSAEIVLLSQLLLQADVPYRAGMLLQAGLEDGTVEDTADHWRLLAQAWNLAQEHDAAIVALGEAAARSDDGELHARIAQSYANLGRWEQAAASAADALDRGVEDPEEMLLLRGMAFFELSRYGDAKAAFTRAMALPDARKSASQWLAYVEREEQRLRDLGINP
jgi:tetratricopeptide (TPR) repeat protein